MGRFGQVLNQMLGTPNPFASAAGYFVSAVQSAASDVNAFNQQAVQQVQSFAAMAQTDISSFNHMLQTNNIVNAIMLPVTNFPQFLSNAEDAATDLESRINTELSYINSQIDYITSLAVYDVSAAATDISKLLNSVYSFSQNGIEIMLGSPLLTMATMINPVIMLVGAVLAADPVKMATDYPAWQSEFSSRQSVVSKNYNSVYTLVSTGLPQAESVLLSILSQLSKFTNGLTNNLRLQEILNESLLSDSFGNQINAALAGIDGVSELPGLDAENNEMHAALQSAAYYHLYSGAATAHPNHADDEFVNIPTPTLAPRASIS
ncbi:hypothetical protein IW140_003660 [Coemansia sp. RSA 1813]|nr:hypothetical protein IW140_003660 [Coemansia sp. RSA 1813]